MKLNAWFKRMGYALLTGIQRFPVTLVIVAVMTALSIWLNHLPYDYSDEVRDNLMRVLLAGLLGIPSTLILHLLLERAQRPPQYKPVPIWMRIASFVPVLAGLTAYGWFLFPDFRMEPLVRLSLLTGTLVLLFGCTPYLWRRPEIPLHVTRLLLRVLVTVLYAGILMLSLFAILFTLDQLLGVNVKSEHYADTAILVWILFAAVHFFAGIPGVREQPKLTDSPKTLRFLLHWILIPLLWVYTAILYAYSVQILTAGEWPRGLVSALILSYTCVGLLVWFLSHPTRSDNRMAKWYNEFFPWASLPLYAILFTALHMRISEYGFTEPRWLAFILALWCMAATAFVAIRSLIRHQDPESTGLRLILLPVSLALVAFVSVVGPLSAFNISISSQQKILNTILKDNGMIENNRLVAAKETVSEADQSRISNLLYWFEQNHSLSDVDVWPEEGSLGNAEEILGFSWTGMHMREPYRYVQYRVENRYAPVDISGYDLMMPIAYESPSQSDTPTGVYMNYRPETRTLTVYRDGRELHVEDLGLRFSALLEAYPPDPGKPEQVLGREQLTFDIEVEKVQIRVLLLNLDGQTSPSEMDGYGYAEGWVLVNLP